MNKEVSIKHLMEPFAKILASSIPVYLKEVELLKNSLHEKSVIKELKPCIKWVIKHSGPLFPPRASEAALKLAESKVDLFALQYKDQLKAESIIQGRKVQKRGGAWLFHEHKIPVETILKEVLLSKGSYEEVLTLLTNQQVIWITREENKRLPHKNRADHDLAYYNAGIALKQNPYGADWLIKNALDH